MIVIHLIILGAIRRPVNCQAGKPLTPAIAQRLLNAHLHFHCCILDGVFDSAGTTAGVIFHAALGLEAAAVRQVQARVRQQVLRAFVRRGLLDQSAAAEMGGWPPRIAPARGPPLWEAAAAAAASNDPAWDHTPPPAPEVEFDQRITW